MKKSKRATRPRNITGLARETWARIWPEPMPSGWRVYLVRKTAIQRIHGRDVCGVTLKHRKTILIGRNTLHYSFQTLVHELAHLRTIDEESDHGPLWQHEFVNVAQTMIGGELEREI